METRCDLKKKVIPKTTMWNRGQYVYTGIWTHDQSI